MRDADRRKLILLAEARATATSATIVIQRLVVTLEQIKSELSADDPLYAPTRVAQDLVATLIDIRDRINQQISEVPS